MAKDSSREERNAGQPPEPADGSPHQLRDRRAVEKTLSDLHRLLAGQQFKSMEEANAFLQRVVNEGGRIPAQPATTPLERAQDVMYEAWDAQGERRVLLAKHALDISLDCADAYVLLAEESAETAEQAHALYTKGVAAGERALGPRGLKGQDGELWGLVECRPYLRARFGLARALWSMGKHDVAIAHYHDLLRLNKNDNQGVRYHLLAALLADGHNSAAKKLLARYKGEPTAAWLFGEALLTFRDKGDGEPAREKLRTALRANPYVAVYMLRLSPLPQEEPDTIGFGDATEAQAFLNDFGLTWLESKETMQWLTDTVLSDASLAKPIAEAIASLFSSEEREQLESQYWRTEENEKTISVASKLHTRLAGLPADWQCGIATFLGIPVAGTKRDRATGIEAHLLNPVMLQGIVDRLSTTERSALELVLKEGWISYEELVQRFGSEAKDLWWWAENPPQSVVGRLRLAGLVYVGMATFKTGRMVVAVVPVDLRPLLRAIME